MAISKEGSLREHHFPVKVYYEDTDAQGVVYHANYLRFFERARSEFLEAHGRSVQDLERLSRHLAVYEMRVKFRRPARLSDRLTVVSTTKLSTAYRITFSQRILRDGASGPLVEADVEVVCLDDEGGLTRIPEEIRALLCEGPTAG